jgi:adenine-specific DNA-methyltransferase
MMYPRLFLARQLLAPDGSIWISIDDREIGNLRQLLNEVFGEENFVATFIWEKRTTRENRRVFSFNHDYIVCYARDKDAFQASRNLLPLSEQAAARYANPDNDPRGDWQSVSLNAQAGHATPAQFYTVTTPSGREVPAPPGRCWSVTRKRLKELRLDNRIWFGQDGGNVPRLKLFRSEANEGLTPHTLWPASEVGTTDSAKKALMELFDGKAIYDTPKPVELLKRIVQIATAPTGGELALDFFAGSGTLGQAIMELNRAGSSDRRFALVQLPEPIPDESEAKSAGYKTIADICAARIARVALRLQAVESSELRLNKATDVGVRYFKLTESNFKPWAGVEGEGEEAYDETMQKFTDPLVEGWKAEDVIWEVVIKEGLSLTSAVDELSDVKSNKVWRVRDADKEQEFTICLDNAIAPETFVALGLGKDDTFICRDAALTDDDAANLALQCRFKTI